MSSRNPESSRQLGFFALVEYAVEDEPCRAAHKLWI
jgi:hypothetical protein